jgi:hypothetical protein
MNLAVANPFSPTPQYLTIKIVATSWSGTLVFLDRPHRHTPFGQSQCGGFLRETHIDQALRQPYLDAVGASR